MAQIKDIFGRETPLQIAQKIDWDEQEWVIVISKNKEGDVRYTTSCIAPVDLKAATLDLISICFRKNEVSDV